MKELLNISSLIFIFIFSLFVGIAFGLIKSAWFWLAFIAITLIIYL